jgi:hypothetical protein
VDLVSQPPNLLGEGGVRRQIEFGLIPTGSDAWLAKGQPATPGSIVLIHGNGNEPAGVEDFLELLRREQGRIKSHDWLLFDLRSSSSGLTIPRVGGVAPVRH